MKACTAGAVSLLRWTHPIGESGALGTASLRNTKFGNVRQVSDCETTLKSGDAITFAGPEDLTFVASGDSQLLYFNLA